MKEPDPTLRSSARRVQEALREAGVELQVVELPASTRSAAEAADAIGCRLEQIAKSIVFQRKDTGEPVLVVASGPNRIDEAKISAILGCAAPDPKLKLAKGNFVKKVTGYAIGGVPPLGPRGAVGNLDRLAPDDTGVHLGRRRHTPRRLPAHPRRPRAHHPRSRGRRLVTIVHVDARVTRDGTAVPSRPDDRRLT